MIAVDTNVLVNAHRRDSRFHAIARHALQSLAQGTQAWAITWPSVHEFYGVVTHPNRFKPASTPQEAMDQLNMWSACPTVHLLGESAMHLKTLGELTLQGQVGGPLIHDARIAAICLQHGVRELWTFDRDFSRFPQLKCRNLLVSK